MSDVWIPGIVLTGWAVLTAQIERTVQMAQFIPLFGRRSDKGAVLSVSVLKENGYRLEEIFLIESPYFRRIGEWRQSGFSLGVLVIKKNELGNFPINDNLKIGEILW